jgi:hypothetical protein
VAFNQSLKIASAIVACRTRRGTPKVRAGSFEGVLGLFGTLGEPFLDFGRPHDPFWHMWIDRAGTDFDARFNLGSRELLSVSLADEGLRTTGIVPGLFFVRNMYGNVPDIRNFLDHDALLSPDRLWSFVAAVPGLVHVLLHPRARCGSG